MSTVDFTLSIWSVNDPSKPADAKPGEGTVAGQHFVYKYNQDSASVTYAPDTTYEVKFTVENGNPEFINSETGKAYSYDFRWINALEQVEKECHKNSDDYLLSAVRLSMKSVSANSVTVGVSSTEEIQLSGQEQALTTGTIDFQVWVEETTTDTHFMCDPRMEIQP